MGTSSSMAHTVVAKQKMAETSPLFIYRDSSNTKTFTNRMDPLVHFSLWSGAGGGHPGVETRKTETTAKHVNNNHTPHKGVMKSRGYGSPGLEPSHTINTTHTTLGKLLVLIMFQFIEYSYKVQYKHRC